MSDLVKTFLISGQTKKGKRVALSLFTDKESILKAFIEKYPRFSGQVSFGWTYARRIVGDILAIEYGSGFNYIRSFDNVKAIKAYLSLFNDEESIMASSMDLEDKLEQLLAK